jgi:hypothetical protein
LEKSERASEALFGFHHGLVAGGENVVHFLLDRGPLGLESALALVKYPKPLDRL